VASFSIKYKAHPEILEKLLCRKLFSFIADNDRRVTIRGDPGSQNVTDNNTLNKIKCDNIFYSIIFAERAARNQLNQQKLTTLVSMAKSSQ